MKDNEIIELYWKRDESAIVASSNTYGNYCYSIAYNILHNNEDAEECVSDTWIKAWNAIPPHCPERLSAFLGKITRNISLNRYKLATTKKRGMGQVELALSELEGCVPAQTDMDKITDEIVLVNTIDAFLREQSQTECNIFIGRYWYLYSIGELSKAYCMSESKVKSMLFRMRNKLKLCLEKEGISL